MNIRTAFIATASFIASASFPCTAFGAESGLAIKTLSAGLQLTAEDCREPRPFIISGTVLSKCSSAGNFYLNDLHNTCYPVCYPSPQTATWNIGDSIRLEGLLSISPENQHFFMATNVAVLAKGSIPVPIPAKLDDVVLGKFDYKTVRIRGVISTIVPDDFDPHFSWLMLRSKGRSLLVSVGEEKARYANLRKLIDAEVEVTGLVAVTSGWRDRVETTLLISSTISSSISIIKPPPTDPFAVPRLIDEHSSHRGMIRGTVAAVGHDRFFLYTPVGRIVTVLPTEGEGLPPVQVTVTVAGFAEKDPFRLRLTEARVRIDSPAAARLQPPATPDIEDLFTDAQRQKRVAIGFHGKIIRLTGRLLDIPSAETSAWSLHLACGRRLVTVDASTLLRHGTALPAAGSTVEVTGLCIAEFEDIYSAVRFPLFKGFTLVLQTPDDLRVIARPPWWTPLKLLIVVLMLVSAIAIVLVWNIALKRRAERRGRELYAEKIGHALAEQKTEERTRLAIELHDSISQTLTGLSLQLDAAFQLENEGRSPKTVLSTARQMLSSCRGELRRCLWDLRSRTFEEKDMTEAIKRTLAPHKATADVSVRFNIPREHLSEATVHAILRIVRELTVNAIRHGGAHHVWIAGERHLDVVSFSVRDDGCGFTPETAPGPDKGHFGLLGIRERLAEFNGSMQIDSRPGSITKITITLPLRKSAR